MTSILPIDDVFDEFATHYGATLRSYIRLLPWKTAGDTVTGYAIPNARGDLHSGYFGSAGSLFTSTQWGSFRSQTGSGTAGDLCAVLWRQVYIARARVSLSFRMLSVAGSAPANDFRWVGVTARNSGGSYDETLGGSEGNQHMFDNTGYWFVLANNGTTAKFILLRVNAGVVTLLKQAASALASTAVTNTLVGAKLLEMTVDDASGDPTILCKYDGVEVFGGLQTDSLAGKITTAGRCGFGMCRDRQVGANTNATVAAYWEVFDIAANATAVRDAWDRSNLNANPLRTDGNGVAGRLLMSLWTRDIYGPLSHTLGSAVMRDPGNNRVKDNGSQYNFSQIQPNDVYQQHRSAVFSTTDVGNVAVAGIVVRGTMNGSGDIASGYRVQVQMDTATKFVYINRVPGGNIARKSVLTGFSLAFGTPFKLLVEIDNIGGTGPSNGTPSIKVFVNDVQVTGWATLLAGVTVGASNDILDGSSGAILSGASQGYESNGSLGTFKYFDEWIDELGSPTVPGDEDHGSIVVSKECDGKTGTFNLIYDWPVEVLPTLRLNEHRYETEHVGRILRSRKQRRRWRIGANSITDSERSSLVAFWEAHKGVEIPFDFPDPEKPAVLVCAHFLSPQLGTVLRNPNVHSFDIVIEELLDS